LIVKVAIPVLVGTYRRRKHIDRCIESIGKHLNGFGDITFVDDSGDPEHCDYLAQFGKVVQLDSQGYTAAMRALCAQADRRESFVIEEDFELLEDVDLHELSEILYHRPYLAQVVLLRGPHFPNEHQHGGVIEALKVKGHKFSEVHGVIEHTACFSMNPSLIRGEVLGTGWPLGKWSEAIKGDLLRQQGYRFGYLPGVRVAHHGEREGHGY
jgi:hypothetical protein